MSQVLCMSALSIKINVVATTQATELQMWRAKTYTLYWPTIVAARTNPGLQSRSAAMTNGSYYPDSTLRRVPSTNFPQLGKKIIRDTSSRQGSDAPLLTVRHSHETIN